MNPDHDEGGEGQHAEEPLPNQQQQNNGYIHHGFCYPCIVFGILAMLIGAKGLFESYQMMAQNSAIESPIRELKRRFPNQSDDTWFQLRRAALDFLSNELSDPLLVAILLPKNETTGTKFSCALAESFKKSLRLQNVICTKRSPCCSSYDSEEVTLKESLPAVYTNKHIIVGNIQDVGMVSPFNVVDCLNSTESPKSIFIIVIKQKKTTAKDKAKTVENYGKVFESPYEKYDTTNPRIMAEQQLCKIWNCAISDNDNRTIVSKIIPWFSRYAIGLQN